MLFPPQAILDVATGCRWRSLVVQTNAVSFHRYIFYTKTVNTCGGVCPLAPIHLALLQSLPKWFPADMKPECPTAATLHDMKASGH